MTRALAGLAMLVWLLAWAPAAVAAPDLEVGIEDERILLDEPHRAPDAVAGWVAAGAEVVRIHARWGRLAPARRGGPYDWTELDRAVEVVRAAGLRIMLTVTGPGPLWTSSAPRRGIARYKPRPKAFARFAGDVARRYGPHVDRYLIWNEPNLAGWLVPQYDCRGSGRRRRCTPAAPHLYRELVRAARPAIRAADPTAEVVAGELAPGNRESQTSRAAISPLAFLREMACVDRRYRPLRTKPCRRFRPLAADAIGHHPHGVEQGPGRRSRDPDWARIGDLRRLLRVLDRLTARRRLLAPARTGRKFDVHLTEFGYQTSPPDHAVGIPVERHADWIQQAAYVAWRTPRIRSLVHYQWTDEPVVWRGTGTRAYAGWQSGLHYVDGRPKPALAAFLAPLVHNPRTGWLWGQIRPGARARVRILARPVGGGDFAPVAEVTTDDRGYWTRPVDSGYDYRVAWGEGEAARETGIVRADRRGGPAGAR